MFYKSNIHVLFNIELFNDLPIKENNQIEEFQIIKGSIYMYKYLIFVKFYIEIKYQLNNILLTHTKLNKDVDNYV